MYIGTSEAYFTQRLEFNVSLLGGAVWLKSDPMMNIMGDFISHTGLWHFRTFFYITPTGFFLSEVSLVEHHKSDFFAFSGHGVCTNVSLTIPWQASGTKKDLAWSGSFALSVLPLGYTVTSVLLFWKVSRSLKMFTPLDPIWLKLRNHHRKIRELLGIYNAVLFFIVKSKAIKM